MRLLAAVIFTAIVSSGATVAIRPEVEPCPEPRAPAVSSFDDKVRELSWRKDLISVCRNENLYDHNPDRYRRCLAEAYSTPMPR